MDAYAHAAGDRRPPPPARRRQPHPREGRDLDPTRLRWEIARRCLHGVDLNPLDPVDPGTSADAAWSGAEASLPMRFVET